MFYVRHHDDQVALFNSKCQTAVLLHHMKKTLNGTGNVDLVQLSTDYKNVLPIGICDRGDQKYANDYLQARATYVLLQWTEDEDGVKDYQVQWKSKAPEESDKLVAALEAKTADERKKGAGKKGKK